MMFAVRRFAVRGSLRLQRTNLRLPILVHAFIGKVSEGLVDAERIELSASALRTQRSPS
jgi:hypothetical protein